MMSRKINRILILAALGALALPTAATLATPITVNNVEADFDRWNYPFNGTPGTRSKASTFGALNNPIFDERDGQFLIGFNTESLGVPAGLDPQAYQISSLTVTAKHSSSGDFRYDPTPDSIDAVTGATPDDPGRPLVLTGAGLRNGFTSFTFGAGSATEYAETTPFQTGNPFPPSGSTSAEARHAFAAGFDDDGDLIDISNNVGTNGVNASGFDITPWAVGTAAGLTAGDIVPDNTVFTFDLTPMLSDPNILGYVQQGLADGGLFFSITSLTETSQTTPTQPDFFTRDAVGPEAQGPQVSFAVSVPEPASVALLAGGAMLIAVRRRRRGTVTA